MKSLTSSTSSLGGLKSGSGSSGGFFLEGLEVRWIPFLVRFMCPLAVAVDSGRYFLTSADVILGKPMIWSLSMDLQSVLIVGENRHWCRYWIVSAMVEVWKALLAEFVFVFVSSTMVKARLVLVSGMYHNLFRLLLIPLLTSCLLCKMMHSFLSNNTWHPWSHNFVTERRFLLSPGIT